MPRKGSDRGRRVAEGAMPSGRGVPLSGIGISCGEMRPLAQRAKPRPTGGKAWIAHGVPRVPPRWARVRDLAGQSLFPPIHERVPTHGAANFRLALRRRESTQEPGHTRGSAPVFGFVVCLGLLV